MNLEHILKKLNVAKEKSNHILNITIVDDFLNKRKIRDKAPSRYMDEFKKSQFTTFWNYENTFDDDLSSFGVWSDNYETFFNKRADLISKEIEKRVIKQKIDNEPQPILLEDYSEEIEME